MDVFTVDSGLFLWSLLVTFVVLAVIIFVIVFAVRHFGRLSRRVKILEREAAELARDDAEAQG